MAIGERDIDVQPEVLRATCDSLAAAADHLLAELKSLDGRVTDMLARWTGGSGDAYRQAWQSWHRGADEVESALAAMATLLGQAADVYEAQEHASADKLRSVHGV